MADLLALEAMSMHMEFLSLVFPPEIIHEASHEDLFFIFDSDVYSDISSCWAWKHFVTTE